MYGIGYISRSLVDTLQVGNGLGKPTIKFEFEDNQALADFLTKTKENVDYAETVDADTFSNPLNVNNRRQSRKSAQQKALTDTPTNYLPPSDGTPSLPPSPTSPKSLPPYNPQREKYLKAKAQYPDAIIIFYYFRVGVSLCDDATLVSKALNLPINNGLVPFTQINGGFDAVKKAAEKLQGLGYNVVVVDQYFKTLLSLKTPLQREYDRIKEKYPNSLVLFRVGDFFEAWGDDATAISITLNLPLTKRGGKELIAIPYAAINKYLPKLVQAGYRVALSEQTTQDEKVLPLNLTEPQPEPTEPEVEPQPQTQTSKSPFEDLKESYERSLHWGSFDPEGRTRRDFEGYDAMYYRILPSIPEDKKDDFTSYFRKKISEIISLQSKAPNAAVTGGGGVSARKAARYNAANDRLMEAYGTFSDDIERYAKRFIKRAESRDTDAIVNKIKREIDNLVGIIKRKEPYSYPLLKSNLANRIKTIAEKGNVEAVEKILDYLRQANLYTYRHTVWQLLDVAKGAVERQKMFENYEQSQEDNGKWHVEYDTDEDRVKIIFDNIPDEKTREWLKKNGFRWSPRNKAWQRQITEAARHAVERFRESGLGKPTIKLEFEDNGELMSLFEPDGISGMTVNDKPAAVFNCPESDLDCQGFKPTYRRLSDYRHLIDAADGAKTLKGYGFEKSTLEELINACRQYKQVERLAAHLKDPDKLQSAFNIWHWLHTNVRYNYDTPGQEEIRTPARTWADRERGVDCDCLAVFTACLLINMGYKPAFEIVAFNDSPTYSHIYVNLDGVAIDRVLPMFMARPQNITKTKIMEIPVYELSGVGVGRCTTLDGVYSSTLAKIQSGTATGNDLNDFRKTQVLVTLKGIDEDAYKLAALLMPHIATVGDDGKYYFDNAKFAEIATKADAGLSLLKQQGASKEVLQNWLAEVVSDIDIADTTATASDEDTIVVVINPKGCPCRVAGNFTATELQTLSPMAQTATAQDTTAAATPSPVYATTPYPTVQPEAEKSNTKWWILGGLAAAFGLAAISKKKNGRR